jgi:hypothetical protein
VVCCYSFDGLAVLTIRGSKRRLSDGKRSSASRPSGEWNDDDFDVLANGEVAGRIFKVNGGASPEHLAR